MCLFAGAGLAIGALSAAGEFAQASANASATSRYNNRIAQRNQGLARDQANQQYRGLNNRIMEDRLQASFETSEITRQAREAQGSALTSALERGIEGAGVSELLADYERQRLDASTAISIETRLKERNAELQKEGVTSSLNASLISNTPRPVQGPNLLGTLVGGLSTGLRIEASNPNGLFRRDNTNNGTSSP